ncbi:hypothetical protein ACFP81_06545 [Deinococcus lacus]|uniref:HTH cro/C1-type domain-containing protein n=1 Tax=Deinococcus lacus TaxID=392561 RepID=A0ABW1YBL5_9DEIO
MAPSKAVDNRAVELGEWLSGWRRQRGLNRPETVNEALKHVPHAKISPDYLSKLEYGTRSLASASPEVREGLRQALNIPAEVWEEETGLLVPAPTVPPSAFDPRTLFHPPAQRHREKRTLWPNLAAMIEEKQERYPQLRETRWQQHLNQTRFANGKDPDPDGWFEMYQAMRRNNVEPEAWPDED